MEEEAEEEAALRKRKGWRKKLKKKNIKSDE